MSLTALKLFAIALQAYFSISAVVRVPAIDRRMLVRAVGTERKFHDGLERPFRIFRGQPLAALL